MNYRLPTDEGSEASHKDASHQMSSTTKYIMNNTEFAMMSQPRMDKAKSGPEGYDPRLANVTPDRTVGETTLSAYYNLQRGESSDLALKNQASGALSSKLQYTESGDDSLSRDTKGTAAMNPFSNESYGDSFVLPTAMAGMSIPKQNNTQATIQMQRSAQSAGKSDSWFSPKPGGDSVSGLNEQALAQQSAQQNGSTVMFGDSYLKSPSTYYKNDRSMQSLQVTKQKQSDSILGQSILKNIDKGDNFDYSNTAAIIVETLKIIAREVAQYQSQNDKLGMEKSLLDYVQVANDEVQNLDLSHKKEQDSAKKILENTVQLIEECSTYYTEVNNIDLYQELMYDTYNNIARIENVKGDIEGSLSYLKMSLSHVKDWHKNPEKVQDIVQVTIIPELYMNICNAQIYLEHEEDALTSADGAIIYSIFCKKLLEQRLKNQEIQNMERSRFETLLESQIGITIKGHRAKAQTYEGMKRLREAIFEYNQEKQIVEQKYGTNHSFFKELVNKISSINSQVKGLDYQVKTDDRSQKNGSFRPSTSGKNNSTNQYFSEDLVDIRSEKSQMGLDEDETFDKIANKSIMLEAQMSSIGKAPHHEDDDLMEDSSIFDAPLETKNQYQGNRGRKLKARVRKVQKTSRTIGQELKEKSRSMLKLTQGARNTPHYYGPNFGRHYTGGHHTRSYSSHSAPRRYEHQRCGYKHQRRGGSRHSWYNTIGGSRSPSERNLSRHSLNHGHHSYHTDYQSALHYRGHIMHNNGHQSTHMGHRCQHQCHYSLGHTHRTTGSTHQHCSTYSHEITCQHHAREQLARVPSELSPATYSGFGGYHPRKCACCSHHKPMPIPKSFKEIVKPPPPEPKMAKRVKAPKEIVVKDDHRIKQRKQLLKQMQAPQEDENNSSKKDYDLRVDAVLQNQQAQQQNLLDALQNQEQRLREEGALQQREQERLRRDILLKRQQPTLASRTFAACRDYRCKTCNPPPEDEPEFGPPVYDPHFKCWTYPYAGKADYAGKGEDRLQEKPPSPRQQKGAPLPPKKDTKEMGVHADYVPPEKPKGKPISTQTAKKEVSEIQIQTGPVTKTAQVQAAAHLAPRRYTPDQAARMLQRIYRRVVLAQRIVIYRQLPGVLYSRKSRISRSSGALEIMSMHMQANYVTKTSLFLRFTIFDYVTRKFTYSGTYDLLDFVLEFNVYSLLDLCHASLSVIDFEGPPFKTHIQTLQHIINKNRVIEIQKVYLPEPPSSEAVSEASAGSVYSEPPALAESPKTPPQPIFIQPAQPLMISSWITTTDDFVPIVKREPEPPLLVPEPPKPVPVVQESKPPPPTEPPRKRAISFMGAVHRIQVFFKWFLAWRDFRTSMMKSNSGLIHSHKMKAVSENHGERLYNIAVWRSCKRHHADPINNYRLIKRHSETRIQHTDYTLVAQETNASHLYYNRSRRRELHKTWAQPETVYQVSYSAPSQTGEHSVETVEYKKAPKNPHYAKSYKALAIPPNLWEDLDNYKGEGGVGMQGYDPSESLFFHMLGWYMRKALYLQIEETEKTRLNQIEFLEYVKIQFPQYYKHDFIQRRFQFLCPIRGVIYRPAEVLPFPSTKHEPIGWHLRAGFAIKRYEKRGVSCLCQVYKRVRWYADKQAQAAADGGELKRKYKDWVLKLTIDSQGCKSSDHIFLAKLPVGLKRMPAFCQEAITVEFHTAYGNLSVLLHFYLTITCTSQHARLVRSEAAAILAKTKMRIEALLASEKSGAANAKLAPKKVDRQQKEREQFIKLLDAHVPKAGQEGQKIVVCSLRYYDAKYEYKRYSREHLIDVYFQQTPQWEQEQGVDPRAPTASSVTSKKYAPFYKTEVSRMLPKYTQSFIPYIHEGLTKHRSQKVKAKGIYLRQFDYDIDSSDDSEDLETDKVKYEEQLWAWDSYQLAAYQDDEFYNGKQLRSIDARSCFDLDNSAPEFIFDPEIDFWPSKEQEKRVAWHFMIANLKIIQKKVEGEEPNVQKIYFETEDWSKFLTIDSVDTVNGIFMAQDIQREENENYACSIFQMADQTFLAEAINIAKPHCRAYMTINSLAGMSAWQTFKYIDKNCTIIYPEKGEDEYMDEEEFVIQRVEFQETPQQFLMALTKQQSKKEVKVEVKSQKVEQVEIKKAQVAPQKVAKKGEILLSQKEMDKLRPIFERFMRGCKARRKFKLSLLQKKTQIIAKFQLTGDLSQIFVFVQSQMTAFNVEIYKVIIFNMKNKVKRHDTQYLTLETLPGGLSRSTKASPEQLKSVFSKHLEIKWVANSNPRLIAGAMVNQQQVDIKSEQKIVETYEAKQDVRSSLEKSKSKSQKKRKSKKSKKKKKKESSESDSYTESESSESSSDDPEEDAIQVDVKKVKKFVKTLRTSVLALQNIREWYDTFDKDKSDEIEIKEFLAMLTQMDIHEDVRYVVMMFKLFDRSDDNYFRYADFEDIILERIKPNYKKIVAFERQKWKLKLERGDTNHFAAPKRRQTLQQSRSNYQNIPPGGQIQQQQVVVSGQAQQVQPGFTQQYSSGFTGAQGSYQTRAQGSYQTQQIQGQATVHHQTVYQGQQQVQQLVTTDQHLSAAQIAARGAELADQAQQDNFDEWN